MQRRGIGTCRIVEFDPCEFERAERRLGEAARFRGRGDGRFGVQQFAEPLGGAGGAEQVRSEEHTSELQSLMRISYAVFCLKKKTHNKTKNKNIDITI